MALTVQMLVVSHTLLAWASAEYSTSFSPPELDRIWEDTHHSVNLTFFVLDGGNVTGEMLRSIRLQSDHPEIADIMGNRTKILRPPFQGTENETVEFVVEGKFLGRATIHVYVEVCGADDGVCVEDDVGRNLQLDVSVVRRPRFVDDLFVGVIATFVCIANVGYGCSINLKTIRDILRKPIPPVIGFVSQFMFMPLVAFGISQIPWFALSSYYQLGLFTNGVSPGGGGSNNWTLLLDGNVELSITMTFISSLAALAMMPLWLYTLGRYFTQDEISIPFTNLITTLLSITIPIGIGLLIKHYRPNVASFIQKWFRIFIILFIVFLFTFGVWANQYIFLSFTWGIAIAGMCLPWLGFLFGLIFSYLLKQPTKNIIAISIETGIQNTGISILVMKYSFPQPEADLGALIPVAASTFTPIPLLLVMLVRYIINRTRRGDRETVGDCDDDDDVDAEGNMDKLEQMKGVGEVEVVDGSEDGRGAGGSDGDLIMKYRGDRDPSPQPCSCLRHGMAKHSSSRCPYLAP